MIKNSELLALSLQTALTPGQSPAPEAEREGSEEPGEGSLALQPGRQAAPRKVTHSLQPSRRREETT